MNIVTLANDIAKQAHEGQFRKKKYDTNVTTSVPYFTHPENVQSLIYQYFLQMQNADREVKNKSVFLESGWMYIGIDAEVYLATALLHDVLEDTKVTPQELFERFYRELSAIAFTLTVTEQKRLVLMWNQVVEAVILLTKDKRPGYSYVKYLKDILQNNVAHLVKLADLLDNMKDLQPGCSLHEKYELTTAYLKSEYFAKGLGDQQNHPAPS